MADHGTWKDVAIPGTSLLTRCLGRGRILMDPGSAFAFEQLVNVIDLDWSAVVRRIPSCALRAILGQLMELGVKISDELEDREAQGLP